MRPREEKSIRPAPLSRTALYSAAASPYDAGRSHPFSSFIFAPRRLCASSSDDLWIATGSIETTQGIQLRNADFGLWIVKKRRQKAVGSRQHAKLFLLPSALCLLSFSIRIPKSAFSNRHDLL